MFNLIFTVQVTVPALISLASGEFPIVCRQRFDWWMFLVCTLIGKACWEYERSLSRSSRCPTREYDWRFWLHPAWHLLAATAQCFWTKYAGDMALAARASTKASKAA